MGVIVIKNLLYTSSNLLSRSTPLGPPDRTMSMLSDLVLFGDRGEIGEVAINFFEQNRNLHINCPIYDDLKLNYDSIIVH